MKKVTHLDVAMLAGEILVQSGSETHRVEDTMTRILTHAHSESTNAFAFTTGIFATQTEVGKEAQTLIRRIHTRTLNLNAIAQVNDISRKLCTDVLDSSQALEALKAIPNQTYPRWLHDVSLILLISGFSILLGGKFPELIVTSLNAGLLVLFFKVTDKIDANPFIRSALGATLITLGASLIQLVTLKAQTDIVIISSMMPLVPGVIITTAIRDTLYGDYMAGTSRAVEALVIAASVAIGVGMGLRLLGGLL